MRNGHLLEGSKEYIVSAYNDEFDENARLREILLGLASRPEVTQETRDWLATQIRAKGKAAVVRGLREDEKLVVVDMMRWALKLQTHVATLEQVRQRDHPTDMWYTQAVSYAEQLAHHLQETGLQLGRDLEDLERAR